MKWKFSKVFIIIFITAVMIGNGNSLGVKITGLDVEILSRRTTLSEDHDDAVEEITPEVLEILQKMGYEGNSLNDEMKIETTITVMEEYGNYYIKFEKRGQNGGDEENAYELSDGLSETDLKNIYGYPDENIVVGTSWDAILIIKSDVQYSSKEYDWYGILEEVYTGDDMDEGIDRTTSDEGIKKYTYEDIASDSDDLESDLKKDILGTVATYIARGICWLFDWVQWLANSIQYDEANDVMYTFKELQNDETKNQYTNVAEGEEGKSIVTKKIKNNENKDDELDFDKNVKIPVMVGDLYNIAVDHIDFFDFNFLTGQKAKKRDGTLRHTSGSAWLTIRDIVTTLIRIGIYVASSILIIALIVFGIKTTKGSIDDPKKKAESKKALEKLSKSLMMLISSILIMAICIFATQGLYESIVNEDSYELPVRVRVQDTYSFSTTYGGYLRYLASNEDVSSNYGRTLLCAFIYMFIAVGNLVFVVVMIARTMVMWGLSIWGPFLSVQYVFGQNVMGKYRKWAGEYVFLAAIQMFLVIINKLILAIM